MIPYNTMTGASLIFQEWTFEMFNPSSVAVPG
jgi:hypothetical protein